MQLQHERAVTAGCQFYTYRPAPSGTSTCLQQQESNLAAQSSQSCIMLRPSTVDTYRPLAHTSSTFSAYDKATAAPVPSPLMMRPGTSPRYINFHMSSVSLTALRSFQCIVNCSSQQKLCMLSTQQAETLFHSIRICLLSAVDQYSQHRLCSVILNRTSISIISTMRDIDGCA